MQKKLSERYKISQYPTIKMFGAEPTQPIPSSQIDVALWFIYDVEKLQKKKNNNNNKKKLTGLWSAIYDCKNNEF